MITILSILLVLTLVALWRVKWRENARTTELIQIFDLKHVESHRILVAAAEAKAAADELPREKGLHEFFETILNEITQGVLIVDGEMRIRFANKPLAELLQRPVVHTGRTLIEELRDHQPAQLVQEAIREGRRISRPMQMLSKEGATNLSGRHFLAEAAPLADSRVGAAWLMLRDVTEMVRTEHIRRDFIANASHELRTPLTIINGYIETLRDTPSLLPRCIGTMEKHAKRLERLTEDMLSISRLEDSTLQLNRESFEMRQCVQDVIDHLAPMLEGRDARIELDFQPQSGRIAGDRFYWDQIFMNLIENALKENPQAGLVVTVSGRWTEKECVLKVCDNGRGISAHDLPFIFKRFFRGGKHHSSAVKGTGLGLSIVKRAVEAHGGAIKAESRPGIETAFTITLPM